MAYNFKNKKAQKEFEKAASFFSLGKEKKAIDEFQKIALKWPDFFQVRIILGEILLNKNEICLAVKHLRKASALNPFDFSARFLLGIAYQKIFRFHSALFQLESALNIYPESKSAARAAAWAKITLGDFEDGRRIINELLKKNILDVYLFIDLGASYMLSYDYDGADKCFKNARDDSVKKCLTKAKSIVSAFNNLSKKEQDIAKSPEYFIKRQRKQRLKDMLAFFEKVSFNEDDLSEVFYELKKDGIN